MSVTDSDHDKSLIDVNRHEQPKSSSSNGSGCVPSYGWMNGSCAALNQLDDGCAEDTVLSRPQISGSTSYVAANSTCQCTKLYFNLYVACNVCQGSSWQLSLTWSQWTKPCPFNSTTLKPQGFPEHDESAPPSWSLVNTTPDDLFDLNSARIQSKSTSRWSPTQIGAIVSISIIALLALLALGGLLIHKRHAIRRRFRGPFRLKPLPPSKPKKPNSRPVISISTENIGGGRRPTLTQHTAYPSSSSLNALNPASALLTSSHDFKNKKPHSGHRTQPSFSPLNAQGETPEPIPLSTRISVFLRSLRAYTGLGPRKVQSNHLRNASTVTVDLAEEEGNLLGAPSGRGEGGARGEYAPVEGGVGNRMLGFSLGGHRRDESGGGGYTHNGSQSKIITPFIVPAVMGSREFSRSEETIAQMPPPRRKAGAHADNNGNIASGTHTTNEPSSSTRDITSRERSREHLDFPPLYSNAQTYPGRGLNRGYPPTSDNRMGGYTNTSTGRGHTRAQSRNPNPQWTSPYRDPFDPYAETRGHEFGVRNANTTTSHQNPYPSSGGVHADEEGDDEGMVLITPRGDDYTIYSSSGVTCSPPLRSPDLPPMSPVRFKTPPGFR